MSSKAAAGQSEEIGTRITKLERDNERLLDMLLEGQGTSTAIDAKMKQQEAERQSLLNELSALEEPNNVVELHPGAIRKTAEAITSIRAIFGTYQIDGKSEAAQTIRAVVESVTVFHNPLSEKGLRIELKGRFSAFREQKNPPFLAGLQKGYIPVGGNDGSGGGAKSFVSGGFRASLSKL